MGRTTAWHNIAGSPIIVTENVVEYRKCIAEYVTSSDVVLEVGCAEGLTTAMIAQHARQVFGIDKSSSQVAKATARHQHQHNLTFHEIEAWDLNSVIKLAAAAGVAFSVVFIDVSGSRRVGDVDNLVMKYEQVFNPRLFVVKSYQLKRLVNRCRLFFCPAHRTDQGVGAQLMMSPEAEGQEAAEVEGGAAGQVTPEAEVQAPLLLQLTTNGSESAGPVLRKCDAEGTCVEKV